jgi:hypothetical protein
VADSERMLRNFHALVRPAGMLCVSDLDTEPGIFHDLEAAATVWFEMDFPNRLVYELLVEIHARRMEGRSA